MNHPDDHVFDFFIHVDHFYFFFQGEKVVLIDEGFESVKLISIAKRFETIYGMVRSEAQFEVHDFGIAKNNPALYLLQKVRDEAHRFAIQYHRSLKEKQLTASLLDGIKGIGDQRKRLLLTHFDSLESMSRSSLEELSALPGMTKDCAEQVQVFLKSRGVF